ncbi:hypothetical protein Q8A73_021035 [Channa argus]|nr:hypothetical protein Q8A73_021035 [Channa argus]
MIVVPAACQLLDLCHPTQRLCMPRPLRHLGCRRERLKRGDYPKKCLSAAAFWHPGNLPPPPPPNEWQDDGSAVVTLVQIFQVSEIGNCWSFDEHVQKGECDIREELYYLSPVVVLAMPVNATALSLYREPSVFSTREKKTETDRAKGRTRAMESLGTNERKESLFSQGMDSDTLAMCAICSCLCGDRMAPNVLFLLLHRGKASASRLGRVHPADMGRGYARRPLRRVLRLHSQYCS